MKTSAFTPDSSSSADAAKSPAWRYLSTLKLGSSRRLPMILQTESTECAVACLAMVAGFYGMNSGIREARSWLPLAGLGTSLNALLSASHRIGLLPRAMRATMKGLRGLTLPAVLHWDMDHYVVLKKVSSKYLWVHDPAFGERKLTTDEAATRFTGIAVEFQPTLVFRPAKPQVDLRLKDFTGKLLGWQSALFYVFSLSLVIELLGLLSPALGQAMLDSVALGGNTEILTTLMAASFLLVLINVGITYFRANTLLVFSTQWNLQWSGNLLRHMLDLRPSFYERRQVGDVISRFGSIQAVQQTLSTGLVSSVLDGIMSIATVAVIFNYSAKLAWIVLAGVGIMLAIKLISYGRLKNYAHEALAAQANASSVLIESVRAMRVVKLFGMQERRLDTLLNRQVDALNPQLQTAKLEMGLDALSTSISAIQRLLLIGVGAYAIQAGTLTIGMLFAFLAYSDQFCGRILSLVDHLLGFRMLRVHFDRLADLVLEPGETEATTPRPLNTPKIDVPDIEFRDVSFSYAPDLPPVFEHLSFTVNTGEWVVMTGASGSGKSTVAKLLLRLEEPTAGEILVQGRNILEIPLDQLRALFGAVMQDDVLLRGSVEENISTFLEVPDPTWMAACVKASELEGFVSELPMGLLTPIEESGSSLSAGQRQRLMIARAIYKRPRILLLDEASSHLDVPTEQRLNRSLKEMNFTRFSLAHRPDTIAMADRRLDLASS